MICLMENTIPKPVPFTNMSPTMNALRQKMNVQSSPPSHFALIHLHRILSLETPTQWWDARELQWTHAFQEQDV